MSAQLVPYGVAPILTPIMLQMMPALEHAMKRFMATLNGYVDRSQEVDMSEVTAVLTFDIIGKMAFGIDTNVQESTDQPLYKAVIYAHPFLMSGAIYNIARMSIDPRSCLPHIFLYVRSQ